MSFSERIAANFSCYSHFNYLESSKESHERSKNKRYKFGLDIFISRLNEYFLIRRSRDHRDSRHKMTTFDAYVMKVLKF